MNSYPRYNVKFLTLTLSVATTIFCAPIAVRAQSAEPATAPQLVADSSSATALPDAPSTAAAPAVRAFSLEADPPAPQPDVAPKHAKYIAADEKAQPIDAHDKVIIGLHDLYSPLNFAAMVASAGYEQALNGSPNYGTDRGAFGERLGAAGIRETTQGVFTDTIFSPMLHMDPRFYVEGPQHNFIHRAAYAATRVLVSKTDSGRNTINAPLLLGYAASTALNPLYYPSINRNFRDTAAEYGGSLGGAAIGFLVSEFSDSLLKVVHMKK